jgi:glycosyltransferase involved in cell wall biosynthesis
MKIAFLIDGPIDQISGGYIYDSRVVETLRAGGDEVEVISLPPGSYLGRMRANRGQRWIQRLADSGADIVLEDELSHPGLIRMNIDLRQRASIPIISLVHHLRCSEPAPRLIRALYAAVERRYLHTVQGFVFNSRATRQAVERLIGATPPSVIALPAGDRLPSRLTEHDVRRRSREPAPLRVVFLGNLIRRKGLHTLLDALAALPPGAAVLEVVGDAGFEPPYAAAVRRRAARLGLGDRVGWTGPLYDRDLAARLGASQLLVVPSSYEGFGIAYLEGMSFGLPAIGTTAGGASDVIHDGQDGFLIAPGDASSLADRIRLLAEDRARLEALSLEALRTFRSHPTWDQTAQTIRRFLVDSSASRVSAARLAFKEETA